jgi:uncharacterized protein (UPF0303 family)
MTEATQTRAILAHLRQHRTITALEALDQHQCFRLAARIKELRHEGHHISTDMVEVGSGKRIAEYTLIKEATPPS